LGSILQQLSCVDVSNYEPSNILLLLNLFNNEKDLQNDGDFSDALADIREECIQYGEINDITLDRITDRESRWAARVVSVVDVFVCVCVCVCLFTKCSCRRMRMLKQHKRLKRHSVDASSMGGLWCARMRIEWRRQ
jgi:hypothetical protein